MSIRPTTPKLSEPLKYAETRTLSPSFDIPGIRLDQSVLRTRIFLRTLVQIH
jgi:hypothetical protein